MTEIRELLLNHCPRVMSQQGYELLTRKPVNDQVLEEILVRLLKKAELYTRMETGDCR